MAKQKAQPKDKSLKSEISRQTAGYIVGSFGIIAGLAWNEAIKSMIEYFYPLDSAGLAAKLLYAVAITIVVAILSYYILENSDSKK